MYNLVFSGSDQSTSTITSLSLRMSKAEKVLAGVNITILINVTDFTAGSSP